MNFCTNCVAELGLGRFCTNCGAPVMAPPGPGGPWRRPDDTVERPAVVPLPPSGQPPSSSRYPLFADEATAVRDEAPPSAPLTGPPTTPGRRRGTPRNTPWVLLLLFGMVAAAATGIWLATRGPESAEGDGGTPSSSSPTTTDGTDQPDETDSPTEMPEPGQPIDLAPHTSAEGPAPVAPGVDLAGNRVTYPVSNMLDDDTQTAYRLPGDASGSVITFRLPQQATITEVGLINGYAKTDRVGGRTVDWYPRNRRVLRVEWRFDDGTTLVQDLRQVAQLQSIEIDPELTQSVQLRLLEVSAPGGGALRKNVTAISDVLLLGS
jgi:hypothetical protein